jgi:hypothetical protein
MKDAIKILVLTMGFYTILSILSMGSTLGLMRPEESLFLEVVDVPGGPHSLNRLSCSRIIVVISLTFAYVALLAAWIGVPYRKNLLACAILILATNAVIVLFHWPEMSFGLRNPNRLRVGTIDGIIIRFIMDFPGGDPGRLLTASLVQMSAVLVFVRIVPRRSSQQVAQLRQS